MKHHLFPITLVALVLVGAGCAPADTIKQQAKDAVNSATQQASEKAAELAAESALKNAGKDLDVSVGKDTWSVTDPKTGQTIVAGDNVKIPEGFPKDIPIYANGKVTSVQIIKADKYVAMLATTMDSQTTVRDWYAGEAPKAGWKQDRVIEAGTQGTAIVFTRTDDDGVVVKFNVILQSMSSDGSTQITITREKK